MIAMKGKSFGLGEFKNCTDFDILPECIWYSIDEDSYNFHIVPDETVRINDSEQLLYEWLKDKRKEIISKIRGQVKTKTNYADHLKPSWTKNHMWVEATDDKYCYLLVFGRLWQQDNIVNNNFGQIQFMCYPERDGQINKFDTGKKRKWRDKKITIYEFKMMYPASDEDGEAKMHIYKDEKGEEFVHCVYNPVIIKQDGSKVEAIEEDTIEAIAKEFVKFIKKHQTEVTQGE